MPVNEQQVARFERGFKTWAENVSVSIRSQLGLYASSPLSPDDLARHMGVRLWTPQDVPGLTPETCHYLVSDEGDEWSALTMRVGKIDLIVFNSHHSEARRSSDLMHELAHLLRKHEPAKIYLFEQTGIGMRTFNPLQEAEADWLAGCLLLPRPALLASVNKRMSKEEACSHFGVSSEMYTYRLNITGVTKQFGRMA